MKYLRLLILLLCGCRTLDKKIIERSAAPTPVLVSFNNSSEAVNEPPAPGMFIGNFTYSQPITNCVMQISPNMREWFNLPDEASIIWWDGSWVIDSFYLHGTAIVDGVIVRDIGENGKMFFRVKEQNTVTQ